MSRIGKLPISFGPELDIKESEGDIIIRKSDLEIRKKISPFLNLAIDNNQKKIILSPNKDSSAFNIKRLNSIYGTQRSALKSSLDGMHNKHSITLELTGVGYKAYSNSGFLVLTLGFSHDVYYSIPNNISVFIEKNTSIILSSDDKCFLGQISSEIIKMRPSEPYKGKGIKIKNSVEIRKEGKKK